MSNNHAGETQEQELNRLRQENAILLQAKSSSLSLKVSEKGAVSVYGMGRFPITLYKEQWAKLFSFQETIKTFIVTNDSSLTSKSDSILAKAKEKAAKDEAERIARVNTFQKQA
jgi:hypothetical protein